MKTRKLQFSRVVIVLLVLLPLYSSCLKRPPHGHPFKSYVERRVSNFNTFPVTSDAVVFLGDSLTDEARWGDIFPDVKTFNRGVGADKTEDVLARLNQVTLRQPGLIFIMIGTNDVGLGVPPETTIANYRQMLHAIKRQSPRTKVFVQSLLPRQAEYRQRIEYLNKALKALALNFKYTYIDLYPTFLDTDGSINDAYANDELHLLGAGYLKWKEIIAPYIHPDK